MKTSKSQTKTHPHPHPHPHPKTKTPKQSSQPKPTVSRKELIQRQVDSRQFFEFPQMKGRILDRVEFYTASDHHHSLTLYFQDKTTFTLVIEPCFLMAANISDRSTGEQRILKRWPVIRSRTERA